MNDSRARLLVQLADGALHSGAALAGQLGVSRAAVAKHVARLRQQGWSIEARRGAGYRLAPAQRPMRREILESTLAPYADRVDELAVLAEVDSTSAWLGSRPAPSESRSALCIAEAQYAGRGRRGRSWHSDAGRSITFSAARGFQRAPAELGALGLAIGVALAELLHAHGADGVGLKWPNDLVCGDAKLGGILIELSGEAAGSCRVIAGVGLNYAPPRSAVRASTEEAFEAAALVDLLPEPPPRDRLAGQAMGAVVDALERFDRDGMAPFRAGWDRFDRLAGRPVRVWGPARPIDGHACGIAADGALLFDDGHGMPRPVYSGEVSVRAQP